MSAINFQIDFSRRADPDGDGVRIVWDGKLAVPMVTRRRLPVPHPRARGGCFELSEAF